MIKKIKGRNLLFKSAVASNFFAKVKEFYEKNYDKWNIIILLPCAALKPIQLSPSHCFLSPISRIYSENIGIFIISEPLTLIPYYFKEYPNYDYPPEKLLRNDSELKIFIERLSEFSELTPKSIKTYYIGGKHHYNILKKANWQINYKIIPKKGLVGYYNGALNLRKKILNEQTDFPFQTSKFELKEITSTNIKINFEVL